MLDLMVIRASSLVVCLLLASVAAAETIYKYRRADGQVTYSNRRLPGVELIETFESRFAPAAPSAGAAKSSPADEARINKHLAALDAAWREVQEATKGLNAAEARLSAGVAPQEGENTALGGPAATAPSEVGGPQPPAPPAAGGPQPAAAPAVGGPVGTRRGGGRNAQYYDRMAELEADAQKARARLDLALRRYNELR